MSWVVLVGGCGREITVPPPKEVIPAAVAAPLPINIGDVEAQVRLYCDVEENLGEAENIDVDRKTSRKYDVGMITIDLYPPYPDSIPVKMWIKNELPKRDVVVVLRGSLKREDQPIQPIHYIVTKDTTDTTDLGTVDSLENVGPLPETMLVHATVEAVLLPATTDLNSIDVENVQGSADTQSVLISNPIRINFHPAKEGS